MIFTDLVDVPIEQFGGYVPAMPPTLLPPGASWNCQDVEYPMGAVCTRNGLSRVLDIGGTVSQGESNSIFGIKTYTTPTLLNRTMIWDSAGNLVKEGPQGTLSLVTARPGVGASLRYQSTTIFGREYMAFYNAAGGFDLPRQFDDTNFDRVSQVGPGRAPSAVDENFLLTLGAGVLGASMIGTFAILASPAGLSQTGFLVTVNLASIGAQGSSPVIGDKFIIAGSGVAGYNNGGSNPANWVVSNVISPVCFQFVAISAGLASSGGGTVQFAWAVFTTVGGAVNPTTNINVIGIQVTVATVGVAGYNGTWGSRTGMFVPGATGFIANIGSFGLAASGGGSALPIGNILTGLHNVSVAFITRQGYITRPAPWSFWNAGGGKRVVLNGIPLGPGNVVARLLIFTPVISAGAVTGTFYSLPNGSPVIAGSTMMISDNTTTGTIVDFQDSVLQGGFQAEYLYSQLELGEPSFVGGYNSRLFWLGERAKIPNFNNLSFAGGFENNGIPMGWSPGASFAGGGANNNPAQADWEATYQITGNGNAIAGQIFQSAYFDSLGVPIVSPATAYGVRFRLAAGPGIQANAGSITVQLSSNSLGLLQQFSVLAANVPVFNGQGFQEFSGQIIAANILPGAVPVDLILIVSATGNMTNGAVIWIAGVEIYPINNPVNYSVVRASHAFNPESYDQVTGQIQIRPSDGQQIRAGISMRNNYYFGKDHYLCYVTDDGINEPSSWPVNEVSATIGICGPNAVDSNEEWFVFAERSGAYICWGSDPVKISQEIDHDASAQGGRVTWQSINWAAAYTIWVRIDRTRKRILFGVPINGATSPNFVFMLDYQWLEGASDIASSPMVTYSSFTGKILSHGRGRRWAPWSIMSPAMGYVERSDGTVQPFFGNGGNNSRIYQQMDNHVQLSDDGLAINSFYNTYYCPSPMDEQMLKLTVDRKLLGGLKWSARGAGNMLLSIVKDNTTTNLRNYALSINPLGDGERVVNLQSERFSASFGTDAVGAWFQMEKFMFKVKRSATIPLRGLDQ